MRRQDYINNVIFFNYYFVFPFSDCLTVLSKTERGEIKEGRKWKVGKMLNKREGKEK